MGKETTIIYYTDGSVEDKIRDTARRFIAAADLPVISVSQSPIDFGTNICVGDIGRSYKSIQVQILAGIMAAKTKYVALAEHDVYYPEGYFDFIPPSDDIFYYNRNRCYAIAKKGPKQGMYILYNDIYPSVSGLVCNRKLLIKALRARLEMLNKGKPYPKSWGEPGVNWDGEKMEWWDSKRKSIEIFHNNNFTVRYGTFKNLVWEIEDWPRFEEIQ